MNNLIHVDFGKKDKQEVERQYLVKKALKSLNLPSYGFELVCLNKEALINNNQEYIERWAQNYLNKYSWDDEAKGLFLKRLRVHLELSEAGLEN